MSYRDRDWNRQPSDENRGDYWSKQQQQQEQGSFGVYSNYESGQQGPPPSSQYRPGPFGQPNHRSPTQVINEDLAQRYNSYFGENAIPPISPEDLEILRQCNSESLYYRCLPLSTAFCAGLYFLGRTRQWNPRFYHYLGASLLGYITGKISYRKTCEDKLLNSRSNSPFVNAIRKRRGLFTEDFGQSGLLNENQTGSLESDWTIPAKSYKVDEFAPENMHPSPRTAEPFSRSPYGNENKFGLNEDTTTATQENLSSPRSGTTYDDLRYHNRSSFKSI